jgi:TPR repeat protein
MLTDSATNETDRARGLVLLEIACGQDDLPSCASLANSYLKRSNNKRSIARAHDLAALACDRRSGEACTVLGDVEDAENITDPTVAWAAYRKGCDLGDARGCELFALGTWDKVTVRGVRLATAPDRQAAAEDALARACELGRLSSCDTLARARLDEPAARQEAAAVLARSCARGYGPSCASVALLAAPLVSAHADCARALPAAGKACDLEQRIGCVVVDACGLADPRSAETAAQRLRYACDRNVGLACLYWADAENRATPPPDADRVIDAYKLACGSGRPAAEIACPRVAAAKLAEADNESEAEAELAQLRRLCTLSNAEACCLLDEQYRLGKWVPADADKALDPRSKACNLGCERCCRND